MCDTWYVGLYYITIKVCNKIKYSTIFSSQTLPLYEWAAGAARLVHYTIHSYSLSPGPDTSWERMCSTHLPPDRSSRSIRNTSLSPPGTSRRRKRRNDSILKSRSTPAPLPPPTSASPSRCFLLSSFYSIFLLLLQLVLNHLIDGCGRGKVVLYTVLLRRLFLFQLVPQIIIWCIRDLPYPDYN